MANPNREIGALVDCEGTTACDAAPGFDGPSGVGTPNGLGLFEPELPTAVIGAPVSLTAGSPAAFTAGSSTSAYPGGTISGASWKWGDGTQSSGISPAHVYAAPGKYTVELTVTDSQGLVSAAVAQQVSVKAETEEEAAAKKKAEEEAAAKKKAEEEAAAKKKAEEEAAAKKKAEEEAAAKKKAEEAAAKKKAEEEALAKKKAEEAAASNEKAEQETAAAAKHAAEGQLLTPGLGVEGFHTSISPVVPDAVLAATSLTESASGAVAVKISCPATESSCAGTVTLRTSGAVVASARKPRAAVLSLASGSFTVPGGKVKTITLHLSAKARALLAKSHSLRIRVTIVAHDPAGVTHTTQVVVTLHAAKPARKKG